jgi:mevalonate kinase
VARPFTIVIGDTGFTAPTKESVGDVRKLWEADKSRWEVVFDQVAEIVQEARDAIETGTIDLLGPLMDANHILLQEMTVSSPELDRLVLAAKASGAEGAKLSGGGRGGNMIALVQPDRAEKVASALISAGAKRTIITTIQS